MLDYGILKYSMRPQQRIVRGSNFSLYSTQIMNVEIHLPRYNEWVTASGVISNGNSSFMKWAFSGALNFKSSTNLGMLEGLLTECLSSLGFLMIPSFSWKLRPYLITDLGTYLERGSQSGVMYFRRIPISKHLISQTLSISMRTRIRTTGNIFGRNETMPLSNVYANAIRFSTVQKIVENS